MGSAGVGSERPGERLLPLASCFDGRDDHRRDLMSFVSEFAQGSFGNVIEFVEQFKPVFGFVGLLFRDGHFGEKLGSGPCMTGGSVVCPDRRRLSHELPAYDVGRRFVRECVGKPEDRYRESLGPGTKLGHRSTGKVGDGCLLK